MTYLTSCRLFMRRLRPFVARFRPVCTEQSTPSVSDENRQRAQVYLKQFGPTRSSVLEKQHEPNTDKIPSLKTPKKHIPETTGAPSVSELCELLQAHGAMDVISLDVGDKAPFADWLVVGTARAGPHVKAVAHALKDELRERNVRLGGSRICVMDPDSAEWQVVDVGSVVIHVLSEEARELYRLESLWSNKGETVCMDDMEDDGFARIEVSNQNDFVVVEDEYVDDVKQTHLCEEEMVENVSGNSMDIVNSSEEKKER